MQKTPFTNEIARQMETPLSGNGGKDPTMSEDPMKEMRRTLLSLRGRPLYFGIVFLCVFCLGCWSNAAGEPRDASSAEKLFPLKSRQRPFVFTEGKREGERMPLRLNRKKEGKRWRLQLGDLFAAVLFRDSNGDLRLKEITKLKEHMRISYHPAVSLISAVVRPDIVVSQQVETRVTDTRTGEVSYQTLMTHRMPPVSRATFKTPAGDYDGLLVQVEQEGTFGLATVTARFAGGFVPGAGLVHAQLDYIVDKPLFFGSAGMHIVELAEPFGDEQ